MKNCSFHQCGEMEHWPAGAIKKTTNTREPQRPPLATLRSRRNHPADQFELRPLPRAPAAADVLFLLAQPQVGAPRANVQMCGEH